MTKILIRLLILLGIAAPWVNAFGYLDLNRAVDGRYVPPGQFPVTGGAYGTARSRETDIRANGAPVYYSYVGSVAPYSDAAVRALANCQSRHAVCQLASIVGHETTRYEHKRVPYTMFGQNHSLDIHGRQTTTRAGVYVVGFDRALWDSNFVNCNDVIQVRFNANMGLAATRQVPVGTLLDQRIIGYGPPAPALDSSERMIVRADNQNRCTIHVRKRLQPGDRVPEYPVTLQLIYD